MWTGAFSALPLAVPHHPDPVRFSADEADEVIAAIGDALAGRRAHGRRADRRHPGAHRRVGGRADDGRVPGQVATLAAADEHGGPPRRALLRAEQGPERDLHQPAPLAAGLPACRGDPRPSDSSSTATCTRSDRPRPSTSRDGSASRRARRREAFETLGDELEAVEVDGERAWVAAGDTAVPSRPAEGVRLLPYFDAYVVAGQPRARLFPGAGGDTRADPVGPGRELPGPAGRRRGRRGLAPAAVGQAGRDHGRAARRPHGRTAARARGGGGAGRRGPRRRAGADDRDGDGRRARVRRAVGEPCPDQPIRR